jgi:hypothetical protein
MRLRVGIIACAARREHLAGDQVFAVGLFQTQRVERVVDSEGRVDDGMMTCNSAPVDMRGTKLVPESGRMRSLNLICVPPSQAPLL